MAARKHRRREPRNPGADYDQVEILHLSPGLECRSRRRIL
jgi:hypothetical protein